MQLLNVISFIKGEKVNIKLCLILFDLKHVSVTSMQKKQTINQEGGKYFFMALYVDNTTKNKGRLRQLRQYTHKQK